MIGIIYIFHIHFLQIWYTYRDNLPGVKSKLIDKNVREIQSNRKIFYEIQRFMLLIERFGWKWKYTTWMRRNKDIKREKIKMLADLYLNRKKYCYSNWVKNSRNASWGKQSWKDKRFKKKVLTKSLIETFVCFVSLFFFNGRVTEEFNFLPEIGSEKNGRPTSQASVSYTISLGPDLVQSEIRRIRNIKIA